MTETNRIEYKAQLTKDLDLEKEVVAFLNYHEGGLVYIGIDKNGNTLGVADLDADMLKIKDRIKNNIAPSAMGLFDVVAEGKDGQHIIKVIVASGSEKPYFKKKYGMTEKGCFLRVGTAAEPMPQAMIDKLFAGRTRNSIGKIKSHRQDLNFEQLSIYYQEKGKTLNSQFKKNLELFTEDGDLNYAAYLLADVNNISIKVAKYKGLDRVNLAENNEYGYCSLIKATKSVLDKMEVENTTFATITSKERIEERLWNAVALREAILNALVHNDYTREVPPKFEIFDDRIEITSAGSLPEGLSQEEFFEGVSIPRNKELMRVFKDVELVEQLGSGIPRILQSYGRDCFKFMDNFTRMVFPSSGKASHNPAPDSNWDTLQKEFHALRSSDKPSRDGFLPWVKDNLPTLLRELQESFSITSGKLQENFGKEFGTSLKTGKLRQSNIKTPTSLMVLLILALDSNTTADEISDLIGVSERSIFTHLNKLKKANLIERVGGRKEGHWHITDQG